MQKHNIPAPKIEPDKLIEYHKAACEKMRSQMATKNAQYSTGKHGYTDGFRNITRTENSGGQQAEFGLIERVNDKLGRIESFLNNSGTPVDKVISDCLEAANYWLIMAALIDKRAENENEQSEELQRIANELTQEDEDPVLILSEELFDSTREDTVY